LTDEEQKTYEEIEPDVDPSYLEIGVGRLRFQVRQNWAYSQMGLHEMVYEISLEMNDETLEENSLAL
jgi:hypothetical protein